MILEQIPPIQQPETTGISSPPQPTSMQETQQHMSSMPSRICVARTKRYLQQDNANNRGENPDKLYSWGNLDATQMSSLGELPTSELPASEETFLPKQVFVLPEGVAGNDTETCGCDRFIERYPTLCDAEVTNLAHMDLCRADPNTATFVNAEPAEQPLIRAPLKPLAPPMPLQPTLQDVHPQTDAIPFTRESFTEPTVTGGWERSQTSENGDETQTAYVHDVLFNGTIVHNTTTYQVGDDTQEVLEISAQDVNAAPAQSSNRKMEIQGSTLSATDFTIAFGLSPAQPAAVHINVADSFARAWAENGTPIKYDGSPLLEADAPPGKDSIAAAGWLPIPEATTGDFSPQNYPVLSPEDENQLFKAYGASYPEAYSVALLRKFSEVKPLPDDNTGDVTGITNSILHPPYGESILLGTLTAEDQVQEGCTVEHGAQNSDEADTENVVSISLWRKGIRAVLLGLGACTLIASILYFAGVLL